MNKHDEQQEKQLMANLKARLNSKLDKSGKCWTWTGFVRDDGFGVIYNNLYPADLCKSLVHRLMYLFEIGTVAEDQIVKQKCGNKLCCNPKHLILVTRSDVSANGKKTHCLRGHLLPAPKQYGERLERVCPECARIRQAEYRKRKAEVLPFEK